ncbi:septal ring lytic transglycosylase RlpA family protein [Sulfurospirillum sp. 1612]|uniref:septal ring lytic transglycosylase RlpA family protein n=1 Tax=Sulfurospirillum sp. 1612 TaxID=3094835 RepID=UPI002F91CAA0
MSYLKCSKFFIFCVTLVIFAGCSSRNYTFSNAAYNPNRAPSHSTVIKNSSSMHKATMRPYQVGGKTYYPTKVSVGDTYSGIASWYGKDFHGRKTSNGEFYNMYAMTAAHKTLPMNTMVKVTNLLNHKSVVVRINDRGPFVKTRIIDLSYEAALRLGYATKGTAPVRLQVIGFSGVINTSNTQVRSVDLNNFYVQIGAFRNQAGAQRYAKEHRNVLGAYRAIVKRSSYQGLPLYRVYLSGFKSEEEARDFIAKGLFRGSFIVGN